MNELISIIVPVYNIEEYLERCLESILHQTYTNLEIILVDDGSKDSSGVICDNYAKKDSRIRVFHKENGGSSSARNLGLDNACGEYIGFIDSDDYITQDMYENLINEIREKKAKGYDVGIAQIGRFEIDENGSQLPDVCVPPDKSQFLSAEEFIRELLLHQGDSSFCTKLFRRDIFSSKRFPIGKLNEDFILLIEILAEQKGVLSLPNRGYYVFYKLGSNTRNKESNVFPRVYKDAVDNVEIAKQIVLPKYPVLTMEIEKFALFTRELYLLHIPIDMMRKDNQEYQEVANYVKHKKKEIMHSPYLAKKDKIYLMLFSIAPRFVRKVHRALGRAQ